MFFKRGAADAVRGATNDSQPTPAGKNGRTQPLPDPLLELMHMARYAVHWETRLAATQELLGHSDPRVAAFLTQLLEDPYWVAQLRPALRESCMTAAGARKSQS